MKMKVTVELFDDADKLLLSQQTQEIIELNQQIQKGTKTNMDINQHRKVSNFIEKTIFEAKLKRMVLQCSCGNKDVIRNGYKKRKIKTIHGEIELNWPKIYCPKCNSHQLADKELLPEDSNINQDLEKVILELMPLTTSFEALSDVLKKTKGIEVSPKEIERIVIERGQHIKKLQTDEYERIDEAIDMIKPKPVDRLYIAADGTYVHSAEKNRESFEGKFGIVFSDEIANISKGRNILLHKRYCASFFGKEDFGELLNVSAYKMGLDSAMELIYVCDGDKSLWKIKKEHFPTALGILDWNHISRNLHKAMLIIEDEPKRKRLAREISDLIWHGQITKPLSKLERLIKEYSAHPEIDKLKEFKTYIENNREWIIDYEETKKRGYYVSSSIMEGTINTIAANRLKKRRSRKWLRVGADSVSRIISTIANNEFDSVWDQIYSLN